MTAIGRRDTTGNARGGVPTTTNRASEPTPPAAGRGPEGFIETTIPGVGNVWVKKIGTDEETRKEARTFVAELIRKGGLGPDGHWDIVDEQGAKVLRRMSTAPKDWDFRVPPAGLTPIYVPTLGSLFVRAPGGGDDAKAEARRYVESLVARGEIGNTWEVRQEGWMRILSRIGFESA